MTHKHTCLSCSAVIMEGDFDCESDQDHDYELCERCEQEADDWKQKIVAAEEIDRYGGDAPIYGGDENEGI